MINKQVANVKEALKGSVGRNDPHAGGVWTLWNP